MKVARVSPVTGVMNYMEIPATPEQLERWGGGELIQNVMPHLTADEREFLVSGCTPEDWDHLFGDEE